MSGGTAGASRDPQHHPLRTNHMVQLVKYKQTFDYDFFTTSAAYLNRYPNPFAPHVLSSDTLECYVDEKGRLRTTRLVVKRGALPEFIRPFLGTSLVLWVIEKSIIDPAAKTVLAYSANVDHRKVVKVEEFLTYDCSSGGTQLEVNVRFSLNFFGLKSRIEEWSKDKFTKNLANLRQGFMYVIKNLRRDPA